MCENNRIDWSVAPEDATHYIIDKSVGVKLPPAFHVDEGDRYRECGKECYWKKDSGSELVIIPRPSTEPSSLKDWDDRYPSVHDDVNHPKHYQLGGGLEAIDVIRASLTDEEYRGYLKGSVLKYKLRCGSKGDAQKDIDKSEWYKKELDK